MTNHKEKRIVNMTRSFMNGRKAEENYFRIILLNPFASLKLFSVHILTK